MYLCSNKYILKLQGRLREALVTIEKAIRSCPCNPRRGCPTLCLRITVQKADILQELRNYRSAAELYWKALSHAPDDAELLLSLGTMYHAMGDLAAARTVYERCRAISPHHGVLKENMDKLLRTTAGLS